VILAVAKVINFKLVFFYLPGSTSEEILHKSSIPVLIVPTYYFSEETFCFPKVGTVEKAKSLSDF
jgi:hypothetical protein